MYVKLKNKASEIFIDFLKIFKGIYYFQKKSVQKGNILG